MNKKKGFILVALMLVLCCLLTGCTSHGKKMEKEYREQGIQLMDAGKYKEAAKMFQVALDQSYEGMDDLDMDIAYYKAAALYKAGESADAIEAYQNIIDYNSKDWKSYYIQGTLYLDMGNTASADADYKAAAVYNPSDYDMFIQMYLNESEKGNTDQAQSYLSSALKIGGSDGESLCKQGEIEYLLGDHDKAKDLLTQAVSAGNSEALLYLTQVCIEQGDYDSALNYVQQGISDTSGDSSTLEQQFEFAKVVVYERKGDWTTAKSLIASYLDKYPDDTQAQKENIIIQSR